jgi:hypothetical protein
VSKREYHSEGENLRDYVGEEILELAILSATKHGDRNARSEKGLRYPEDVIKNLDVVAHGNNTLKP